MNNTICNQCPKNEECETPCAAIETLFQIYDQQSEKDEVTRIRNLKKQLGIQDAEPSKSLKRLAEKIIKRFPEFSIIREFNIKIGYVVSQERKRGEKITYADCRKVQEVFKAYLPFDFIITFYERNTGLLSENHLEEDLKSNRTDVSWFHQSKNKTARITSNATWVMNHVYYPANWRAG